MTTSARIVELAADAALIAVPRAAAGPLRQGAPFTVVSHAPEGLVLIREGAAPSGFLAGSLHSLSVEEVYGQVLAGIRTGKLVVQHESIRRAISFRDGQIIFATSNAAHERLGFFLTQLGYLSPEQLEAALREVGPKARLGQVLTRAKLVTPVDLYAAMAHTVREIAIATFEMTHGHFLFLEGLPLSEDALKLPERTREVVLEGIRRSEIAAAYLRRYRPDASLFLAGEPPVGTEAFWGEHAAGATVAELRALFPASAYAFFTWLDERVQEGTFELADETPVRPEVATSGASATALEQFQSLIRHLCRSILETGHSLRELQSFFEDPLPGLEEVLRGVRLTDHGELNVEQLFTNVKGATGPLGRAKVYEALDSFMTYALFSAKNAVAPEVAESLAAEYRRVQEGSFGG